MGEGLLNDIGISKYILPAYKSIYPRFGNYENFWLVKIPDINFQNGDNMTLKLAKLRSKIKYS
jgi:hypothetical protein